MTVLFVGLDMSSLTAVRTLACGTNGLIVWGRCCTWGAGISLYGGAEDTFLLFASVATLLITLKTAEFFFYAIFGQQDGDLI